MEFLSNILADGSPNPDALLTNATLVSALYHGDRRPFNTVAALTQSTLAMFRHDPSAFEPDVAVLVKPGSALIVMDGTTNTPQWLAHCASAFFPLVDQETGFPCVGSFLEGLRVVEPELLDAIRPATRGKIYITGHSYGAGAAKIFCDHLAVSIQPPEFISFMSFGEPRATAVPFGNQPVYTHLRIVGKINQRTPFGPAYGLDPVTFCPPGILQCYKWPLLVSIPLGLLGFKWKFAGTPFTLNDSGLSPTAAYSDFRATIDAVGWLYILENTPWAYLHLMDEFYLTQAEQLWRRLNQTP